MRVFSIFVMVCCLQAMSAPVNAITVGQLDDFQDGSVMDWAEGLQSPNPPTNVLNGGPGGTGDSYIDNVSSGGFGPGSRMIMFNRVQWTGDYTAAGVQAIAMDLANFGSDPLSIRIAIGDVGGKSGTWYSSADAFDLPADGLWYSTVFDLDATDLSLVQGPATLDSVLSNVSSLRILSAATSPSSEGDEVDARLGVDNITALPAPIPGDANRDGTVDVSDLGILATNYGITNGADWADADFTGDGAVDVSDLGVLASHYGESAPEVSVPEPSTLAGVLVLCLMAMLPRVCRKR